MAGGRPSEYTSEMADRICDLIASGESVSKIAGFAGIPVQDTIYRWIREHAEFSEKYTRAREQQAEVLAEQIVSIADDESKDVDGDAVKRSHLRVEARKWVAAKLLPKKYGDKLDLNVSGELALADRVKRARERSNG